MDDKTELTRPITLAAQISVIDYQIMKIQQQKADLFKTLRKEKARVKEPE